MFAPQQPPPPPPPEPQYTAITNIGTLGAIVSALLLVGNCLKNPLLRPFGLRVAVFLGAAVAAAVVFYLLRDRSMPLAVLASGGTVLASLIVLGVFT